MVTKGGHMPDNADLGTLEHRDGKQVLRFERHLRHPVDRVWAALTETGQLLNWWGEVETDLTEGGTFVVRWRNTDEDGNTFAMHGTITRFEPPTLLETSAAEHGVLRWELRPERDGTALTFTSTLSGLPGEMRTRTLAGWHYHLDALDGVLADRPIDVVDLPNAHWTAIHDRYLTEIG
jgi:uncharacterized protein YndB with AHSA1/START domain